MVKKMDLKKLYKTKPKGSLYIEKGKRILIAGASGDIGFATLSLLSDMHTLTAFFAKPPVFH